MLADREYAAVRQRIRYAKTADARAALRTVEEAAKAALNAAREHHRALLSQCESQRVSQGPSHRPVPVRPVPSRSNEDEDGAVDPRKLQALRELPGTATLKEKVRIFGPFPSVAQPALSES